MFSCYSSSPGVWNFPHRPRNPPYMDTKLSFADNATEDELDEEFDSYPTLKTMNYVKVRYDRLRAIAARLQALLGDLASQCERIHALLSWRDPRATLLFLIFSLLASVVSFFVRPKLIAAAIGVYVFRHPMFRTPVPSAPLNFFRRLPSRAESML